jgi:Fe-S-cluster containining protein
MKARCLGHCCEAFTLPMPPDEIWAAYYRWLRMHTGRVSETRELRRSDHEPDGLVSARKGLITDIHLIAPMVVYLGYGPVPWKKVVPDDEELLGGKRRKFHIYTCKHFDKKKRECTIYEFRPMMCRDYPYGKGCNYAACTWKHHKRPAVDLKKKRAELKAEKKQQAGDMKALKKKMGQMVEESK